jgi:hypothetical protein
MRGGRASSRCQPADRHQALHLDLYLTGHRTIPTIGWLFLLQAIAAFGLGLAVLATGGRPVIASMGWTVRAKDCHSEPARTDRSASATCSRGVISADAVVLAGRMA